MNRRHFLTLGATLGASSLVLDGCGKPDQKLIPLLVPEEEIAPGMEQWIPSLCQQCPAGCGITVRVMPGESLRMQDGQEKKIAALQAKKVEGNPLHPLNQGKSCALGQSSLQILYHPDRLQGPFRLAGSRGSGQFQPVPWEEALNELTARIKQNLRTGESSGLALVAGDTIRGSMQKLLKRFSDLCGTGRLFFHEGVERTSLRQACKTSLGIPRLPVYDLENAKFLLSLGANLFETYLSPVHYNLAFGRMRQGRPECRGKFVYAGPRLSSTAATADQWVPILPGREGQLALSLAHVMVSEGLYNRDFVDSRTRNFEEWSASLQEFAPEDFARQIGISAESITALAREFAKNQPGLVIAQSEDPEVHQAVLELNALAGNIGKPGGILEDADTVRTFENGREKGISTRIDFNGKKTSSEKPAGEDTRGVEEIAGKAKIVLLIEAESIFLSPAGPIWQEQIKQAPFVVSFTCFRDKSTTFADLILPVHTFLERWGDDVPEPGVGMAVRTLCQPVVKPRFNTRHTGDLFLELGRNLGDDFRKKIPWPDFESMVRDSFIALQGMEAQADRKEEREKFWQEIKKRGGWWQEEISAEYRSAISPGKFNFQKSSLQVASATSSSTPPAEDAFELYLYPSPLLWDGRGANMPWLQETPDPMTAVMWGSWVELSPVTAARLKVREGDLVEVQSSSESVVLPVYVFPGIRPDVVAIPLGQGISRGRFAGGRGTNPLRLLNPNARRESSHGKLVMVRPAKGKASLVTFGKNVQIPASLLGKI